VNRRSCDTGEQRESTAAVGGSTDNGGWVSRISPATQHSERSGDSHVASLHSRLAEIIGRILSVSNGDRRAIPKRTYKLRLLRTTIEASDDLSIFINTRLCAFRIVGDRSECPGAAADRPLGHRPKNLVGVPGGARAISVVSAACLRRRSSRVTDRQLHPASGRRDTFPAGASSVALVSFGASLRLKNDGAAPRLRPG